MLIFRKKEAHDTRLKTKNVWPLTFLQLLMLLFISRVEMFYFFKLTL